MTSSPGRGRRGLQSLGRASYCGFAFRRYSTLNFLPISPNEKFQLATSIFFYDRRKKNTIDGVDNKLLHTLRDRSRCPDARATPSGRKTSFLSDSAYRHTDSDHAECVFLHSVHFGTCDV